MLHIEQSISSTAIFAADSITSQLQQYHHFFLCSRLFLLNLAAIYITGFECPDTSTIIPELQLMLAAAQDIYSSFNKNFPSTPLPVAYLELFQQIVSFVGSQPSDYNRFNHFSFIRNFLNPLFGINQQCISTYGVV